MKKNREYNITNISTQETYYFVSYTIYTPHLTNNKRKPTLIVIDECVW